MEKKRIVPVWVSVVLVVMVAANLVLNLWSIVTQGACINTAFSALCILIDLCALDYCVMGYSKFGALFFKLYCWLSIVLIAAMLYFNAMSFSVSVRSAVLFLLPLLEMMLFFAFAVVPDLGRKKSLTLVSIISGAILAEGIINTISNPALFLFCAGAVVTTAVFFLMVYAKYQDKAARGTK